MKLKEIVYGLQTIESPMIPAPKVGHTVADQDASRLRTLLPSMTAGFHVLGAGPTFSKTLT